MSFKFELLKVNATPARSEAAAETSGAKADKDEGNGDAAAAAAPRKRNTRRETWFVPWNFFSRGFDSLTELVICWCSRFLSLTVLQGFGSWFSEKTMYKLLATLSVWSCVVPYGTRLFVKLVWSETTKPIVAHLVRKLYSCQGTKTWPKRNAGSLSLQNFWFLGCHPKTTVVCNMFIVVFPQQTLIRDSSMSNARFWNGGKSWDP